jgi:hypothetical protein
VLCDSFQLAVRNSQFALQGVRTDQCFMYALVFSVALCPA